MKERVWLRHGSTAGRFALAAERKLDVLKISSFWKLDLSTIGVGVDVLEVDDEGKSLDDIDGIAEWGFGDGRSEETAFDVRGTPSPVTFSSSLYISSNSLYETFANDVFDMAKSIDEEALFRPRNVVNFPGKIPFLPDNMRYNALWIHECYHEIAEAIESSTGEDKIFHLLGTPGVGKSVFGILWLLSLALKNKTVLYRTQDCQAWILYNFSGKDGPRTRFFGSYVEAGQFVDSSVWLILDGLSRHVFHPGPVLHCVSEDQGADSAKLHGKIFYLQDWSQNDCEQCAEDLKLDVDDLELRYFYAGGVPRYLFNSASLGDLKSSVDNAAVLIKWEDFLISCVGNRDVEKRLIRYSYSKNEMDSCEKWMGYTTTKLYVPASPYAQDVMLMNLLNFGSVEQAKIINTPSFALTELRKVPFLRLAHEELSRGGVFSVRNIEGKASKSEEFRKTIRPQGAVCQYSDKKLGQSCLYAELFTSRAQVHQKDKLPLHFLGWEHYVKPVIKPDGALDSFLTPGRTETGLIFRVELAPESRIKWEYVENLVEFLDEWCERQNRAKPSNYWLVFVVPERLFPVFSRQGNISVKLAQRLEQYVLAVKA